MSHSGTSPKVAQGRPRSPGEVGRRSPGKRTSPVGGASPGRPCLGARANGSGQDQLGDLSARQLALFSGPPAEPRSGDEPAEVTIRCWACGQAVDEIELPLGSWFSCGCGDRVLA